MSKYFPPRSTWSHLAWCCAGFALIGLFLNWFFQYLGREDRKEPVLLGQYEVRCGEQPVLVTQLWQQGQRNYYLTNGRIVPTYDTEQCQIKAQHGNLPR